MEKEWTTPGIKQFFLFKILVEMYKNGNTNISIINSNTLGTLLISFRNSKGIFRIFSKIQKFKKNFRNLGNTIKSKETPIYLLQILIKFNK